MTLLGQTTLGIIILVLLGLLVVVKQVATGAILDRPQGTALVQAVNIFNLFFLLVVNPLTAILLLTQNMVTADPSHVVISAQWLLTLLEVVGMVLYVAGFLLMAWALITLSRNYQLGGSVPRPEDKLVAAGPYRLVRHPMYASALSIALGLALLVQSVAVLGVFGIYVILLAQLIPVEEHTLSTAYGDQYGAYQRETKKIVPFVY